MDNVPSSAILLTIAIVLTCFTCAYGVRLYHQSMNVSQKTTLEQDVTAENVDNIRYTTYDGITITGSGILRLLKDLSKDPISVQVEDIRPSGAGSGVYHAYLHKLEGESIRDGVITRDTVYGNLGAAFSASQKKDMFQKAKLKSLSSDHYIPSDQKYVGKIIRSKSKVITAIVFSIAE